MASAVEFAPVPASTFISEPANLTAILTNSMCSS
jgi:hypothetical protein